MNSLLNKAKVQGTAVSPYRFLKMGAADNTLVHAVDASAAIVAVSDALANATANTRMDVGMAGLVEVECGGVVTRGDFLTADASGKAVAANLVTGTTVYHGGIAQSSGVAGDIIEMLFAPGVLHNDYNIAIVDVTISSAELLALNAVPKTLLAAPGAGKSIIVDDVEMYKPAGTAYDGIAAGENLEVGYAGSTGLAQIEPDGFLDQAGAGTRVAKAILPGIAVTTNLTPIANTAIVARLLVGEIATGDTVLKVRLRYHVIDMTW